MFDVMLCVWRCVVNGLCVLYCDCIVLCEGDMVMGLCVCGCGVCVWMCVFEWGF